MRRNQPSSPTARTIAALSFALVVALLPIGAVAQDNMSATQDKLKAALDVLKKAKDRKDSGMDERTRGLIGNADLEKRARAAIENIDRSPSKEEITRAKKAAGLLDKARGNLTEEGAKRLAATRSQVQVPVEPPSDPTTGIPSEVADAPDPKAKKPRNIAAKKNTKATIIETGPDGTGIFDGDKHVAVFADDTDGVKLNNPDIYILCEELEVHFHEEDAATKEAKEAAAAAGGNTALGGTSSIDVAYARGRKVFLQKKNPNGKIQIGQCREAIFDGDTGDLVLKVWPQIQENDNLVIATAETTQIIIMRDGRLKFIGPTETRVANE